jgi:hypothetical protein
MILIFEKEPSEGTLEITLVLDANEPQPKCMEQMEELFVQAMACLPKTMKKLKIVRLDPRTKNGGNTK